MYKTGTLVEHTLSGTVGVVTNTKQDSSKICWVKFGYYNEPKPFPAENIQPISFRNFAWYQDPSTGRYKIGKNGAIPVILSCLMGLLSIGLSFTVDGVWMLLPAILGTAVVVVNYLGLRYNYTGRWV